MTILSHKYSVRTRILSDPANDYQVKYTYDYRNRETDGEDYNNSGMLTKHVHLVYDSLDQEIGKQVDDTGGGSYDRTERYVLDGGQPVAQFDGNGNETERDLSGPSPTGVDEVMAQEGIATQGQAGTTNWDLTDSQGTLHDVISNSSAVIDHVMTDAFGDTTSESNTSVTHWAGFTGGHTDADTGDLLSGERRYDASTGDWTTKDPIGLGGGDANTGRYADNSPTNVIDPTGLYGMDGHFWTTYIVATSIQNEQGQPLYTAQEAYSLAYYSQLPDQMHDLNAIDMGLANGGSIVNTYASLGLVPAAGHYLAQYLGYDPVQWPGYTQQTLHSLHGGGPPQVLAWRGYLGGQIQQFTQVTPDLQQAGFLIHALGDAYAHTYQGPGGPHAYSSPFGHLFQSHTPDIIMNGNNFDNYKNYVQQLYASLGGQGLATENEALGAWLNHMQQEQRAYAANPAQFAEDYARRFARYKAQYVPGSYNTDGTPSPSYPTIWQWMVTLHQVQQGMGN